MIARFNRGLKRKAGVVAGDHGRGPRAANGDADRRVSADAESAVGTQGESNQLTNGGVIAHHGHRHDSLLHQGIDAVVNDDSILSGGRKKAQGQERKEPQRATDELHG